MKVYIVIAPETISRVGQDNVIWGVYLTKHLAEKSLDMEHPPNPLPKIQEWKVEGTEEYQQ